LILLQSLKEIRTSTLLWTHPLHKKLPQFVTFIPYEERSVGTVLRVITINEKSLKYWMLLIYFTEISLFLTHSPSIPMQLSHLCKSLNIPRQ